MLKVKRGTKTSTKVDTTIEQKIDKLSTEAFDAEIQRKKYDKLANKHDKVKKAKVVELGELFDDNGVTDIHTLNRTRGEDSYNIKVGSMDDRAVTTVHGDKLFDEYKAGKVSDEELKAVLMKLTKKAIDEAFAPATAVKYYTSHKPKKFMIKVK